MRCTAVRRTLFAVTAALSLSALQACASFNELTGPKALPSAVASVDVPVPQPVLSVGGTIALQAMARDSHGGVVSDRPVVWSSSDTTIARVSSAGVVTAVGVGLVRIAASVDGKSAVASLSVTQRGVASVVVRPGNPSILVGGQLQLFSTMLGESGDTLAGRNVLWSSSDPKVASVDNVGLLTGLSTGVTTVTATSENRTAAVGVTVSAVPVSSVLITPSVDSVVVGQTTQLTASPRDSIGGTLGDRAVVWLSSDPATATVTSSGTVLGTKAGSVTISATSEGKSGTSRIIVKARPVSAIIVSPSAAALTVGQTVVLSVLITDDNGTLLTGRPVQFASSNANIAQVASDGTVTAKAAGTASITITSEGRTGTASITVSPSPVSSVRIDPSTTNVLVGASLRLSAVALDGAGNTLSQRTVTWMSGAPTVLTVAADGTITGVGAGTGLVFATVEGRMASASVTVRAVAVSSVVLTPTTSSLFVGDALDLSATVREAGGSILTGRNTAWASSDERIVVISSAGRARALAPGQVLITATVDGVVGSASIAATNEPVLTLTVEPSSLGMLPTATATLVPTARGRNGVALTGRGFAFTSADPTIATVSSSGLVTAIKTGATTVTVTSEGKSVVVNVTISPAPVATVAVAINDASRFVGQTTLAVSVAKDAQGNVLAGRTVVWSSSDAGVATVTPSGVVTAVSPGTATITATVEGKSASANVAVALVPVASVGVVIAAPARFVGQTTQATATTRDGSGNVLIGRSVAWSSSNGGVASVSATGAITALGVGTANIVASSEGQSGSAVITVTVPPVASVAVTAPSTTRYSGQTTQASATLRDAQGNVLSGRGIVWASSDAGVASVTQAGVVTALNVGNASITATSEGIAGSVSITVTPVPVETINVTLAKTKIALGQNTQASAVTLDPSGNVLTGRTIAWSSSNPTVLFVSPTGFVTGLTIGTANVIATSEGKSGSAAETVVILPVGTVNVVVSQPALNIGQTSQAIATTVDTSGTVVTGRDVSWSSSAPGVASVTAGGTVTAVSTGTTNIIGTSEGVSGSTQVIVALAPVAFVTLQLGSNTIVATLTTTTSVTLLDGNNNVLSGRAVTYSSSVPSVATVSASGIVSGVSAGTTSITASSEGKSNSVTLSVTPAPVASVSVALTPNSVTVGQTSQASATTRDANSAVLAGRAVAWSSSNNSVATVNTSTGLVTAQGTGTATITATSETKTGSAILTVSAVPVATVGVTLTPASVTIGQTSQATATTRDANSNVLTGRGVSWSSNNTSVATVDATTGAVTTVAQGTAVITATSETKTGSATLTVSQAPVATVTVTLAPTSVTVGQTSQASAATRDASNNVLASRTVTWSSANPGVATVDASSGVVTAVAVGSATITATSEGKSGSATLSVSAIPVATVTVTLAPNAVTVGQTSQATASTRDASNNVLTGRSVAWSSGNPSVATVDATTGMVTAVAAGTAVITATSETKSGSATLTVGVAPVASVTVALTPSTTTVGQSSQATATTRDSNNNVLGGRMVTWTSSNTSVATVNASSGLISAVAVGSTVITATSETKTGNATLNVTAVPVSTVSVALTPANIAVGATSQATATTRDANNNALTGRAVTWSSANTSVATVDPTSGLVTAVAAGSAVITATSETKTGTATLTVTAAPVATVGVTLAPTSVLVGQTSQASATTRDASNNVLTGRSVTWSSGNLGVATVNSTTGVVTAVSSGTAVITGTSETKTGSATLTVTAAPVATVTVALTPTTVAVGQTSQATATTRDASNNTLSGRVVTWSSGNAAVATVNASSGVITTVGAGSSVITATSETKTGTATLTVTVAPVDSVNTMLTDSSITTAQTVQATAVLRDANNNVLTGRTITWSTSNSAIATVSASGLVSPVSAGTVNIIATSEGVSDPVALTIIPAVSTVSVALAPASVIVGQTSQATATTRDSNNNTVTGRAVTWSSGNTNVATVNSSTGLVTSVAAGSAIITATSETKTGTATLTVTVAPVAAVAVALAPASVAAGQTSQATATTRDSNNNVLTGRTVVWSSANTSVATVNASTGLVTAVSAGSAVITATSETKTGTATLTVTIAPVASVSVTLAQSSVTPNSTTQATAVTRDANNNVLNGRTVTWSSSDTAIATVSASGLVTAKRKGTAQITATSETQSGFATVTVP